MKIGAFNVWMGGFSSYHGQEPHPPRLPKLVTAVQLLDADIMGLIDTHRWTQTFSRQQLRDLFGYRHSFTIDMNCTRVDPRIGLTVITRDPTIECEPIRLFNRNAIKIWLRLNGQDRRIYLVYLDDLHESIRRRQVEVLLQDAQSQVATPTIIMGDYNALRPEDITSWQALIGRCLRLPPARRRWRELAVTAGELTRTEVIPLLRAEGFRDARDGQAGPTFMGRSYPLTRHPNLAVDHIFSRNWPVSEFTAHYFPAASDHAAITARV